jgi:hypothetical protein
VERCTKYENVSGLSHRIRQNGFFSSFSVFDSHLVPPKPVRPRLASDDQLPHVPVRLKGPKRRS